MPPSARSKRLINAAQIRCKLKRAFDRRSKVHTPQVNARNSARASKRSLTMSSGRRTSVMQDAALLMREAISLRPPLKV